MTSRPTGSAWTPPRGSSTWSAPRAPPTSPRSPAASAAAATRWPPASPPTATPPGPSTRSSRPSSPSAPPRATRAPPATGALVVALGRATRLLPFLPMEPKRYLAGIAFGAETDTLDASGVTTGTAPVDGIDEAAVARGLERFLGPQQQVPPMVSAVKLDGERLYVKARRGETVERAPRPVIIHALELCGFQPGPPPLATVAVTCSGGTYVRVLAGEVGRALGSVAHLASLRRTAVGAFSEREARTLSELE